MIPRIPPELVALALDALSRIRFRRKRCRVCGQPRGMHRDREIPGEVAVLGPSGVLRYVDCERVASLDR